MKKLLFILFAVSIIFGCARKYAEKGTPEYINAVNRWHKKRIERLKRENGWLNLVGLYWLKEGVNTFGSGKTNDIIFPEKAPDFIGEITLRKGETYFKSSPDVKVLHNGEPCDSIKLENDMKGNPTALRSNSFKWFIIKRGDKFGIRLRDLNAELLSEFTGIERFPVNEDWRIEAKYIPFPKPKEISIPTAIGTIEKDFSPGMLEFKIGGKRFSLEPTAESGGLFIVFADETNGEETYGAGRFLFLNSPDSLNNVIVDFNKAYNPPCAFTRFATCPLPIKENQLRIKITAGEKKFGKGH